MNSTLIEKIKGFLYLGNYQDNEEKEFGIIKVFPYLCPDNLEKTKERAICESHHLRSYKYQIYVRSKVAIEDITKVLICNDFSCRVKNEKEENIRQWFSTESDLLRYLVYDEARISVRVEENELERFVEIIKGLRESHSYRNIYLGEDEAFYIV